MVAKPAFSASSMAPVEIDPADPPDPSPWNLPFQAVAGGSQTSKPIWESLLGVTRPMARQKGRDTRVAPALPPSGSQVALWITAPPRCRPLRAVQFWASSGAAARPPLAARMGKSPSKAKRLKARMASPPTQECENCLTRALCRQAKASSKVAKGEVGAAKPTERADRRQARRPYRRGKYSSRRGAVQIALHQRAGDQPPAIHQHEEDQLEGQRNDHRGQHHHAHAHQD